MDDREARAREIALELALKHPDGTIVNRLQGVCHIEARAEQFRKFLMGEPSDKPAVNAD